MRKFCGHRLQTNMMFKLLLRIFLLLCLTSFFDVTMAMQIRLAATNTEGTAGFVEAYYNNTWGLVGNPGNQFSITTAHVLCEILGKSKFGYGASWTPINKSTAYTWEDAIINCLGHETEAGHCQRLGNWTKKDYSKERDWAYKYGSSLYCVESRLVSGNTSNSGIVESIFNDKVYQMCSDDFTMRTADVVCRHLGYEKALIIENVALTNNVYNKVLVCNGDESSVSKCEQQERNIPCKNTASVTCEAVRLATLSGRPNEGVVEVYNEGMWGMVWNPGFAFDSVTASNLCRKFGQGNIGFGTQARYLRNYDRIAWTGRMQCHNNETNVMNCRHGKFSKVPPVMYTFRVGSWLHCYPYTIEKFRLTNGNSSHEGRVEMKINGQWGSVCASRMTAAPRRAAGDIFCKEMGYPGIYTVFNYNNTGNNDDLFWMREVMCYKDKIRNITDCSLYKGSSYDCYLSPEYLKIRCKPRVQ